MNQFQEEGHIDRDDEDDYDDSDVSAAQSQSVALQPMCSDDEDGCTDGPSPDFSDLSDIETEEGTASSTRS
jgi:hypothetical protein